MQFLDIKNGYTLLYFSRIQLANLARACWFASEEGLNSEIEHWRTLASLFQRCATAGSPSKELSPPVVLHPGLSYVNQDDKMTALELSAGQCISLAKACYFASKESPDTEVDHWLTFAWTFHACAFAALGQNQMTAEDLELVEEQLINSGLQEGVVMVSVMPKQKELPILMSLPV